MTGTAAALFGIIRRTHWFVHNCLMDFSGQIATVEAPRHFERQSQRRGLRRRTHASQMAFAERECCRTTATLPPHSALESRHPAQFAPGAMPTSPASTHESEVSATWMK